MRSRRTLILVTLAGALGVVAIVAAIVAPLVPMDRYKPRLETAASRYLGMSVRIVGRMRVGLLPGFHISAYDGHFGEGSGAFFATVKRTDLYPDPFRALLGQFRLRRVAVREPDVTVTPAARGDTTGTSLGRMIGLLGGLDGVDLSVSGGTVSYADSASGAKLKGSRVTLAIHAADHFADVRRLRFGLFGGEASGNLHADYSHRTPRYRLRISLPDARIERILGSVSADSMGEGSVSFLAELSLEGVADSELVRSLAGKCSLRGERLALRGTDLDQAISRFESSRHFHLVDVGAAVLAGPLGLAVTKGVGYTRLFLGSGERTEIPKLVSEWRIQQGVARPSDAAFITRKHRFAIQGGLDFARRRYDDLTVAVVDDKGCAQLKQTIHGSFDAPDVDKPSVISALIGPVAGIVKEAKDLLPLGDCDPFYTGSVKPPGSEPESR